MKNFIISYKENEQFEKIIIKAENLDKAEKFFNSYNSEAILYGILERSNVEEELNNGMQCINAQ